MTDRLPGTAAAVRVYGHDGACAALFLDLDSAHGTAVEAVERDARRLTKWLAECGARVIEDVSPTGGRHLYVPLAERLEMPAALEMVEALAKLFPTLDPSPHRSARTGCIRTPGSRHGLGGNQELVTPLAAAVDVLHRRNPVDVVTAMRIRLAPQIAAWHAAKQPVPLTAAAAESGSAAGVDDVGPGAGRRGLSRVIVAIAREGIYDTTRYPSPSEARMAVMTAAARAGWSLTDVTSRLEGGLWPGLAGMYEAKVPSPASRRRRIADDWRNAQALVARTPTKREAQHAHGDDDVLRSNTSLPKSQGGTRRGPVGDPVVEHAFVRTWLTAVLTTEQHRLAQYGVTIRWLCRAMAEAAHKRANRYIDFGCRSLSIGSGCDHTTVAALLKILTREGWVDRIEAGQGTGADLYALTIPADLRGRVEELRWHHGRAHALRPAFRDLGHVAALVFEALEMQRATTITELATVTGCSRSAVSAAVDVLVAYELVERTPGGLLPQPGHLTRVAEDLGVLEAVAVQLRTYARHRRLWRAYLARHDAENQLTEADLYDPPDDDYWLPPPDDATWTLVDAAA